MVLAHVNVLACVVVLAHVNVLSHYIVSTSFMVLAVNCCYGAACVMVLSVSPFCGDSQCGDTIIIVTSVLFQYIFY